MAVIDIGWRGLGDTNATAYDECIDVSSATPEDVFSTLCSVSPGFLIYLLVAREYPKPPLERCYQYDRNGWAIRDTDGWEYVWTDASESDVKADIAQFIRRARKLQP